MSGSDFPPGSPAEPDSVRPSPPAAPAFSFQPDPPGGSDSHRPGPPAAPDALQPDPPGGSAFPRPGPLATPVSGPPPVAIVTGGSGAIGKAVAALLAARGHAVVLAARQPMGLVAAQNEIHEAGGRAITMPADVTDPAQVGELVEETERRLGPIRLLVNAAGVAHRAPVAATAPEDFDRTLRINLGGTFRATRAVLPGMIERREGRIVNVASVSGRLGTPRLAAYCASKWGVIGFTKACAEEHRRVNVQAFAVCPGSLDSPVFRALTPGAKPLAGPKTAAEVAVWLGTDAPAAMTGAVVDAF